MFGFNEFFFQLRSSWEQRRRYREVERKAHEIKSITASIEAPLQLIIILYLMLRGILTLPWNESTSSSCIEDNLGRVACLPSIPMLAITFSILSIIKSMFDLNIHPLLANQVNKTILMAKGTDYSLHINFLIPISYKTDGANLWYFNLY